METNSRTPMPKNPELLDKIIGEMQIGLIDNLSWLNMAYSRAERIIRLDSNNKKLYIPTVYSGIGNDYIDITPNSNIGNFCFFVVDDPQDIDMQKGVSVSIKTNFSIIFWFDFRTILNDDNDRNKESIKKQILDVLNNSVLTRSGHVQINRVHELAENIYRGFSLDEVDNQFLMHPYGGFRFDGALNVMESCTL